MQTVKNLWKKEPLMIVGLLGTLITFLVNNWNLVQQLLQQAGISEQWLILVGMFLTLLAGRQFVSPAK